jgi:putative chitinase
MIDREYLIGSVRASLYGGAIKPSHVMGILTILEAWERLVPAADLRWIAYSLATAYHETAFRFEPLREFGRGKGKKYGIPDPETRHVFYGRGFVQLTWKENYLKMGRKLGFDFVSDPDKVMEPKISAEILVRGMVDGDFTGKGLGRYISGAKCDYVSARRIVNGTDRAEAIAGYARRFEIGLRYQKPSAPEPSPPLVAEAPKPVFAPAPVIADAEPIEAPRQRKSFWQRIKERFWS